MSFHKKTHLLVYMRMCCNSHAYCSIHMYYTTIHCRVHSLKCQLTMQTHVSANTTVMSASSYMCLHVSLGNEPSYYEYLSGLHSENRAREGGGGAK